MFLELGAFALAGSAVGGISAAWLNFKKFCRIIEEDIEADAQDDFFSWQNILSTGDPIDVIEERHNPEHDPEHPLPGVPEKIPSVLIRGLHEILPNENEVDTLRRHRQITNRAGRAICSLAKAEFGSMEQTSLAKSTVWSFCGREVKARNIPPEHRHKIILYATHMYWLPTPLEKELARVEATYSYTNEANYLFRNKYYRRTLLLPSWFPFNRGAGF